MDIRLPNLGEGIESGTVTAVLVRVGDAVEKDQPLIELESEKAIASVPSVSAGTITRVHVKEGQEVRAGSTIVSLDVHETTSASGPALPPPEKPLPTEVPVETGSPRLPSDPTVSLQSSLSSDDTPTASPSIRKMARTLGIALDRVRPSGRGGRIELDDLRDYIARLQALPGPTGSPTSGPTFVDFSRWGPVTSQKASGIRRTIAKRMVESWSTIPHVTQFLDADITRLMEYRQKFVDGYKERGARLTLTPIVFKAVAFALARHPILNSSLEETSQTIVTKEYYHIGMAVDTEAGLLVPVIRDVNRKSIFDLALEVEALSARARRRETSRDEMQGGTFTISNQGGIGGGHFTPIINKPEVAILGVGRGTQGLSLRDGSVEPRLMLPLALSHDHRVVDGADGVRFLADLVDTLENFPESELALS
jgi:pyruvate dehydrogenase E2 component (dihydrolipoamide acetyltransferase)